LIQEHKM